MELVLKDEIVSDRDTAIASEAGLTVSDDLSTTMRIGIIGRQSDRMIKQMTTADIQGTAEELTHLGQIAELDNAKVYAGARVAADRFSSCGGCVEANRNLCGMDSEGSTSTGQVRHG